MDSTVNNLTVETPAEITGKDGKKRKANMKRASICLAEENVKRVLHLVVPQIEEPLK